MTDAKSNCLKIKQFDFFYPSKLNNRKYLLTFFIKLC